MTRDFAVARIDPAVTTNRGNRSLYTLGDEVKDLSGSQSLVQLVILTLLNSPGSHVLDPSWGVGIATVLRTPVGSIDDVKSLVAIAISQARDQIVARQVGESMEDDERLAGLTLRGVRQDEIGVAIDLEVQTAAGSSVIINSRDYFV